MAEALPGFEEFIDLLRGREPFPWLVELTDGWLCEGRLPAAIDVPTGLGKTSVIDCWAYALAAGAARGDPILPRRLCFVVDRRLIVDAAFEHARGLAAALADNPALRGVADALASLSGAGHPLECVRMRGGLTWESRWLARPDRPAVVVGTVDQFGSRLLFRGYGTSARMRPIDAALLGTDTWLVIDEAHIAEAMVETAERAARLQGVAEKRLAPPLSVTAMTATPASASRSESFRADPDEQMASRALPDAAAEAGRRLRAEKPVALVELPPVKKRSTAREGATHIGELLAVLALQVDESAELVGVLCNTIAAARAAHAALAAEGSEAALLIGRCREYEREAILNDWLPVIELGAKRDGRRRFVVATQTIEVGANLDLDAAVCEIASLDSLVQRFGRVNRIGERQPQLSLIAHCDGHHEADPIYGDAAEATWRHLKAAAAGEPRRAIAKRQLGTLGLGDPQLDLGPLNARALSDEAPADASQSPGYVPVLLGSDVERWAATYPAPEPEQAVAPFIRGEVRAAPEVQVAWRANPPFDPASVDGWRAWLEISRPVEWEFVSVPVWEVRALVSGAPSALATSDLEGGEAEGDEGTDGGERGEELLGVSYAADLGELSPIRAPEDVRVGRHLVFRSDVGGHDRWGWSGLRAGDDEMIADVGDLAPTRRRGIIRLHENVFATALGSDATAPLATALRALDADDPETLAAVWAKLIDLHAPGRLGALIERARRERWRLEEIPWMGADADTGEPDRISVLRERGRDAAPLEAISNADEWSSSQTGAPQPLRTHLRSVANHARAFAEHLRLPQELQDAVERAALWHDLGKTDPRFQTMLHDGDEFAAMLAPEPLAKSGRDPADPLARRAAALAHVPRGFRHEAVSARIFERLANERPELLKGLDKALIHHLIASHHGTSRPLFPALVDPDAGAVSASVPDVGSQDEIEIEIEPRRLQVDWDHPASFQSLCERYGWWGLALLETIVRLADMLASEEGGNGARGLAPVAAAGASR